MRNTLKINEIQEFCGRENIFFTPDADHVDDPNKMLYRKDHPFIYWLLTDRRNKNTQMKKKIIDDVTYYSILKDDIEKRKIILKKTIFEKIKYTNFIDCYIECDLKDLDKNCKKMVIVLLEINYCKINDF